MGWCFLSFFSISHYSLKLYYAQKIELIITRKLFSKTMPYLNVPKINHLGVRLLKFEPTLTTEWCWTRLPSCLWWSALWTPIISIVNSMGCRTLVGKNLRAWEIIYIKLLEVISTTLNGGGTIPWPGVLDWIKKELKWTSAFISIFFLTAGARWPAASSSSCHDISAMMDFFLKLSPKRKTFCLNLLLYWSQQQTK